MNIRTSKILRKSQEGPPALRFIRFLFIFFLPFAWVLYLFPFRDPIFLENKYPFIISSSGSGASFNMGFSAMPENIPTNSKPPLLSAIGIPSSLFEYQRCFYHKSLYKIKDKEEWSDTVSLDVRVKIDSQTTHLPPNTRLCYPGNTQVSTVIFVGGAETNNDSALQLLMRNNNQPIQGESVVSVVQEPIQNKYAMLFFSIFSSFALWWGLIIAGKTVYGYV